MDKEDIIAKAKSLRRDDQLEESQELLLSLLDEYPDDPRVLFEVGGSYDVLDMGWDAIPYYKRAIEEGLQGSDLQECLVCLGSTHRAIGNFDEALEVLERAAVEFPDQNSGRVFLALAHYSSKNYEESVRLLIELLLETTRDDDILAYADALEFYKDNINEVWDE